MGVVLFFAENTWRDIYCKCGSPVLFVCSSFICLEYLYIFNLTFLDVHTKKEDLFVLWVFVVHIEFQYSALSTSLREANQYIHTNTHTVWKWDNNIEHKHWRGLPLEQGVDPGGRFLLCANCRCSRAIEMFWQNLAATHTQDRQKQESNDKTIELNWHNKNNNTRQRERARKSERRALTYFIAGKEGNSALNLNRKIIKTLRLIYKKPYTESQNCKKCIIILTISIN